MRKPIPLFFGIALILTISSCVTQEKVTYLQVMDPPTDQGFPSVVPDNYKVMVDDNLYIRVVTPDPRLSSMFNTAPMGSATMAGEAAIDLVSYSVNSQGCIDVPFVGSVKVEGLVLSEIKGLVESSLIDYINDADITVKLVNNYVSVLGEVARPGLYPIYKQRLNIFQSISLAGDLLEYSDRRAVHIIRQTSEGSIIKEFDLTDRNIVDSEFYYVMPNDVIYVKSMKGKFFRMNSFPYAVILSTLTTFILLLNLMDSPAP